MADEREPIARQVRAPLDPVPELVAPFVAWAVWEVGPHRPVHAMRGPATWRLARRKVEESEVSVEKCVDGTIKIRNAAGVVTWEGRPGQWAGELAGRMIGSRDYASRMLETNAVLRARRKRE